ncbi:UvrD-helicase domain-containing protein [Nocardia sp. NPDC059246]|uniref:UvrD-helicase domain-containing protein n=1 Tax=unclassified Nocardia TaxID=2637762 RepID=UPI0036C2CCE6
MTEDVYRHSHPLTAEQQVVVDQPWDARVLVTAGAGAGKTHTLVRRLDALIAREELAAAEILVLSFSRAAVKELSRRIARHAVSAKRVRVQTFDAWAISLLVDVDEDGDWRNRPFDERIEAAVEAIERGFADDWYGDDLAHIVIDEVQDLLGSRRRMVEALITRFRRAGLTVVGDSAQAIYGFQVEDRGERAFESNRFVEWLRAHSGSDLVELQLSRNFRARTPEARTALSLGADVGRLSGDDVAARKDAESIHRLLRDRLSAVESFGALDDEMTLGALADFPGSCAILTRNNGQALLISEALRDNGIRHNLKRAATSRPAPGWLADLFDRAGLTVNEAELKELAAELLIGSPDTTPDEIWRVLRNLARERRRGGGTVTLDAIRQAIAERRIPDELVPQPAEPLTISTIHRAKGLEFDRVIIAVPSDRYSGTDADPAEDARLLYVAMTRPRDDLFRIDELTRPPALMRKHKRIDRWYPASMAKSKQWWRGGMEALGSDVDACLPPGTGVFPADPVELQHYLRRVVHPGDRVELRLLEGSAPDDGAGPEYVVYHADRPIGEASEQFRIDLHRLLKLGRDFVVRRWPQRIVGITVDTIEAVAGSQALTERAGLGDKGIWRVPRLCGLGRFHDWTEFEQIGDGDGA